MYGLEGSGASLAGKCEPSATQIHSCTGLLSRQRPLGLGQPRRNCLRGAIAPQRRRVAVRIAHSDSGRDYSVTSTFEEDEMAYENEQGWGAEGRMQGPNRAADAEEGHVIHSTMRGGSAENSNGVSSGPSSTWPGPNGVPSPPARSGSMRDPIAELEHLLALPGAMHPVVPPPQLDGPANGAVNGHGRGGGGAGAPPTRRKGKGSPPVPMDVDSLPPLPRADEIDTLDDPVAKLESLLEAPGAPHPTMPPPPYADEQLERIRQHDSATFSGRSGRAGFQRKESTDAERFLRERSSKGRTVRMPRRSRHPQPSPAELLMLAENPLEGLDLATCETMPPLYRYRHLCHGGYLEAALQIVEGIVHADRADMLRKMSHKDFLAAAADAAAAGRKLAVKLALRFTALLPRDYSLPATYNMAITVCVRAKDLAHAQKAADMMRSTGRRLDTILYTNLLHACASVGNAEEAFRVAEQMKADRVRMDVKAYTALIDACATAIRRLGPGRRREQLVLLERASSVMDRARERFTEPDPALWNALITTAARALQLQRAFQVLEDMQAANVAPNGVTYGALIEACAKCERKDLALRVYHKALREGHTFHLHIYAGAMAACRSSKATDLNSALEIYGDMQRNGVQPDPLAYATLMLVAGAAGKLDVVEGIITDMDMDGLLPSQEAMSAWVQVYLMNGMLEKARAVYCDMQAHGLRPNLTAYNMMINEYGKAYRLGDAVRMVTDLTAAGLQPDVHTYGATLNACQRASEGLLAFEVYQLMKQQGFKVNSVVCFIMLRLCFNKQRLAWWPGGYPPGKDSLDTEGSHPAAGRALIRALGGMERAVPQAAGDVDWGRRAHAVYRDLQASGIKPDLLVLDKLMACFRIPYRPDEEHQRRKDARHSDDFYAGLSSPPLGLMQAQGLDNCFDGRAVRIVEEAISIGALPQFKVESAALDLRSLPPTLAEVYLLAIVRALQRPRTQKYGDLVLRVPAYDPRQIFTPSHGSDNFDDDFGCTGKSVFPPASAWVEELQEEVGRRQTGLAVAATLRRIGLWAIETPTEGRILIQARELSRFVRAAERDAATREEELSSANSHEAAWSKGPAAKIAQQASTIRSASYESDEAPSRPHVPPPSGV